MVEAPMTMRRLAASLTLASLVAGLAGILFQWRHDAPSLSRLQADDAERQLYSSPGPAPKGMFVPGSVYGGLPPKKLRKDVLVNVLFLSNPTKVEQWCAPPAGPWSGCTDRNGLRHPIIVVTNPCAFTTDYYAIEVCHELGHANGWPDDHRGGVNAY